MLAFSSAVFSLNRVSYGGGTFVVAGSYAWQSETRLLDVGANRPHKRCKVATRKTGFLRAETRFLMVAVRADAALFVNGV